MANFQKDGLNFISLNTWDTDIHDMKGKDPVNVKIKSYRILHLHNKYHLNATLRNHFRFVLFSDYDERV